MPLDSYRHPVREVAGLEPDAMIEHNRRVHHLVLHAGARFYEGGRWFDVFGDVADAIDPNDTAAYVARRDAERARIPAYVESPRPAVPSWW